MLKYKLKNNAININSQSPIVDYLRSLGIEQTDSFIGVPPKKDELSPWLLDNMEKCVYELHQGFNNNRNFFLQVDSDVDGLTSAAIFYHFFKGYFPNANIVWRLHDEKEHGVIVNTVPEDTDYIILPDSGSMQLEEQKELIEKGKKIIILDHHNVSDTLNNDNVILVNNQISRNFTNKDLSGAGVVFKTIQAYAEKYPHMHIKPNHYYDLAALGLLSDMMAMDNLDNNYIVYQGLHNITNELFKAILQKQAYSISNPLQPNKIDVVFYVAPLLNGVIRAGSTEEKELIFKALLEQPDCDEINTVWRGQERTETFYEYAARTAYNVKNRQNTNKEKCFEFLCNRIKDEKLDEHKVIVVVASKDDSVIVPKNITGLIAMELLKEFNKPILVLRPKMESGELIYAGSGRGKSAEGFDNFLQFVRDSHYTTYGEGHAFAFGAAIPAKHLQDFIKESDERLANVDFSTEYIEVDAIFNAANINYQMLYEFGKYDYVYGNSIPQPKIAIEAVYNSNQIMIMGKDSSSVRITIDRLSCIKFKDKDLIEKLTSTTRGKIKLIGRTQINYYMGNEIPQLFIDNIEVEPITAKSLF